jgi:competence protein ComEA
MSDPSPSEPARPPLLTSRFDRLADLIHRIRSGDDPVAFGAIIVVLALAAGLVFYRAGVGGGSAGGAGAAPLPRPGEHAAPPPDASPTTAGATLVVHVAGAVRHPGLYRLAPGSRVADALDAAGGPQPGADTDRLNLAARLTDGQRVAVPRAGAPAAPGPADTSGGAGPDPAEPIDLNTAGLAELETLPHVGPATAQAILLERNRRGGFRSPRDLLRIPGIGERRFADLRDRIRV